MTTSSPAAARVPPTASRTGVSPVQAARPDFRRTGETPVLLNSRTPSVLRQAVAHGGEKRGGEKRGPRPRRRGAVGTLDYVLVLAIVLPMVVLVMLAGPRMIRAVYEMLCVMISWPFP